MILRLALMLICLGPLAAMADDRLPAVNEAFGVWLEKHKAEGVLALFDHQTLLGHSEHGMGAETIVETASLSKMITGLCVGRLVEEGALSWTDRFSRIHGHGPDVPLSALATHTSGLWPDGTQMGMLTWLDDPAPRAADALALVELRNGQAGTPGEFRYNNENYALLGLAIEDATGQEYASACAERVLSPAGASGAQAPRSGGFLPWGGWGMTVADYGRMMAHWLGPGQPFAKDPGAGPNYHFPNTPTNTLHYGPGYYFRPSGAGYNFWLFGGLCFPGRFDSATFAVTLDSGETMVLAYDTCLSNQAVLEMQGVLVQAIRDARAP